MVKFASWDPIHRSTRRATRCKPALPSSIKSLIWSPHSRPLRIFFWVRSQQRRALFIEGVERQRASELFERVGVCVDSQAPVQRLSIAQQQVIEIAKALSLDAQILVMDEPSATLTPQEVHRLSNVIRDLKSQGMGIVYITHRLDEVFDIADRVMVLRDGNYVGTYGIDEVDRTKLIE